jgi:hypothetical protein
VLLIIVPRRREALWDIGNTFWQDMGNTFPLGEECHAVEGGHRERAERQLRSDYGLRHYSVTELAERYSISRKTAYKWIERYEEAGQGGT